MSQPLLSIAIPTLNRVDLLKGSVNALLEQIIPYRDQVEFLILNNASEDGTAVWLDETFTNHAIVKYKNFSERVGIVESITRCIEGSTGDYLWIFGDDDLAMPFAVETILRMLISRATDNYSILYFNCIRSETTMQKYTSVYDNRIEMAPVEMSLDTLVNEFHIALGLIITIVFKRENWIRGKDFYKDTYYGYGFLAPLFAGSKGTTCLYYPFPISIHRIGAQRYVNKWPLFVLIGIPSMLDDTRKAGIVNTNPLKNWQDSYSALDLIKVLIVAKVFNYKYDHFFWQEAIKYQEGNRKRLITFFRYFVPSWAAKIVFNLGASLKAAEE